MAAFEQLEEERRLIAEAKRGDLDAMRPIFEGYASPLYATVILPRLGDAAAAEDVLRDTFATALEKLERFEWTGCSIYAWLRQIAVNKVYDIHRKTVRSRRLADAVAAEVTVHTAPGRDREQPDAMLIAREERRRHRERIDETMAALPDRYRTAIELRLVGELPRDECARRLGVTTPTFDVVLFRAVRAFRKRFGDRNE